MAVQAVEHRKPFTVPTAGLLALYGWVDVIIDGKRNEWRDRVMRVPAGARVADMDPMHGKVVHIFDGDGPDALDMKPDVITIGTGPRPRGY